METRRALARWLEFAVDAYGGDLPVRAPGSIVVRQPVPETEPEPERVPTSAADAGAGTPEGEAAPAAAAPTPAAAEPARAAEAPADAAAGLAALAARLADCTRCKLHAGRTQVVFGEGNPRARVMFIGEAPGFHEDQQGRPFVGPAGQLLDRIITGGMGLRREDVYIANVNKCRPPNNRDPEPDEVAACLPFLREQVRLIRPEVIVCLGRVASSNLLGTTLHMRALRGRALTYEGIPVVVTWHPAYLLRNPAAKRETWEDIKRVNRLLGLPEQPARPASAREDASSQPPAPGAGAEA